MTRLLLTRGSVLTVEEERPVAKDDNNEQCNEPSWLGPYGETVVVIRLYVLKHAFVASSQARPP